MIIFTDPVFLQIGAGLALLVTLGLWSHTRRRRRLAAFFGGKRATARMSRVDLYRIPVDRLFLLGIATLALSAAAAGPAWVVPEIEEPVPAPERSIVLAIDVSASMQGTDVLPTRLGRASDIARTVLEAADGDRVGLLLFAGRAYSLAPPTYDHDVIHYFLDGLTPTIASAHDPGSLLTVGINTAVGLLGDEADDVATERVILLLSDGGAAEDESAVAAAARNASSRGITVHTVGLGTRTGSQVVLPAAPYQLGGRLVDEAGAPIVTRIRPALLQRAAEAGGGRYSDATSASAVADLVASFERPVAIPASVDPVPRWQTFDPVVLLTAVALLMIAFESLLHVRLPRALSFSRRRAVWP